jgi:hypothetical protein
MEFHLPFFALRKLSQSENSSSSVCELPTRKFKDLLLVKRKELTCRTIKRSTCFIMLKSLVSYMGMMNGIILLYAFKDTGHEENDDVDINSHGENDALCNSGGN